MYIDSLKDNFKRKLFFAVFLFYMVYLILAYTAPTFVLGMIMDTHVEYGIDDENKLAMILDYADFDLDTQEIYLETEDGETIWCALTIPDNPKAIVIHLSGLKNPSATQFYGHSSLLSDNGIASMIVELRAHGNSSGHRICLGFKEHLDVAAAIQYIKNEDTLKDIPIIVHGVSMGGATAINSFGLYNDIDACIAMSPYASFEKQSELWVTQQSDMFLPFAAQIRNSMLYALRSLYGNAALDITPYRQIKNADGRPILLIACEGDTTVPAENAFLLKESYPEAEFWLRDSDEHLVVNERDYSNVMNDAEYCNRILGFIDSVCK